MSLRKAYVSALALTVTLAVTSCAKFEEYQAKDKVKQRVFGMLDGVQKGGAGTSVDTQRAICLWYNGSVIIHDTGTLGRASDLFLVFQNEGGIARQIAAFTVADAQDAGNGAFLVSGTIEARPFTLKVTPNEPMSWVISPKG